MRISKLPKQMNNPDEAPLYPNSPDYTNSETALNYFAPTSTPVRAKAARTGDPGYGAGFSANKIPLVNAKFGSHTHSEGPLYPKYLL
jgi:hypothetical protein